MSWGPVSKAKQSSGAHLVQVDSNRAGQRLDNFLSARLKGVPKTAIYRMIRTGQVRINSGRCKPASRLAEGDQVRIPPARTRQSGEFVVSDAVCRQVEEAKTLYEDLFQQGRRSFALCLNLANLKAKEEELEPALTLLRLALKSCPAGHEMSASINHNIRFIEGKLKA